MDLDHCAAPGRQQRNRLLFANRHGTTTGHISELDDDVLGRLSAIVKDDRGNRDQITLAGRARGKANCLRHDYQIGQGGRRHRQGFSRRIVPFIALWDQVIRIDLHLDLAISHFARQGEGGRECATAANGNQFDKLFATYRRGNASGHIDKLDQHMVGVDFARVEHHGM